MWRRRESNPRPSACEADALPCLSYIPLVVIALGVEPRSLLGVERGTLPVELNDVDGGPRSRTSLTVP